MLTPESGSHWGIFGGSFDPVHYGHLNLVRQIMERKHLNGVIIVPTDKHPFKKDQTLASFDHRFKMLQIAFENDSNILITDCEVTNNLTGYAIDIIRFLKDLYKEVSFSYIVGEDILGEFSSWHKSNEIIQEVNLIVGSRKVDKENMNSEFEQFDPVLTDVVDVSSSKLKEKLKNNTDCSSIKEDIPQEVCDYIKENSLYI